MAASRIAKDMHGETFVARSKTGWAKKTRNKGSELAAFCAWEGEVLVLNVLGFPLAGGDAIGKPKGKQLCISVTATPVAGKATDHMVRFLAAEFGVTVADIDVVFGRYNVNKQLRIRSPKKLPAVIRRQLSQETQETQEAPETERGDTLPLF